MIYNPSLLKLEPYDKIKSFISYNVALDYGISFDSIPVTQVDNLSNEDLNYFTQKINEDIAMAFALPKEYLYNSDSAMWISLFGDA